jgi:hypothetical protein
MVLTCYVVQRFSSAGLAKELNDGRGLNVAGRGDVPEGATGQEPKSVSADDSSLEVILTEAFELVSTKKVLPVSGLMRGSSFYLFISYFWQFELVFAEQRSTKERNCHPPSQIWKQLSAACPTRASRPLAQFARTRARKTAQFNFFTIL